MIPLLKTWLSKQKLKFRNFGNFDSICLFFVVQHIHLIFFSFDSPHSALHEKRWFFVDCLTKLFVMSKNPKKSCDFRNFQFFRGSTKNWSSTTLLWESMLTTLLYGNNFWLPLLVSCQYPRRGTKRGGKKNGKTPVFGLR